jgi:hypothetical protein
MTEALTYDEESQRPFLYGRRVLSVTDVLKVNGLYDAMPVDDYYLWMGQARHKAVELWVKKTLDLSTVHPDITPSLNAYLDFEDNTGFKPYPDGAERKVWNQALQLATRPDLIGQFPDGAEGIVELKSGAVAKPTALQTAGQDIALGGPRRKRYGLSIPKTGKPSVKPFISSDDYTYFMSFLNTARWKIDHLGLKL